MDITDTTAEANEVLSGKVFYAKSGVRTTGSLSNATTSSDGLMSSTDKAKLDNITTMVGASSSVAGIQGLVPAPTTSDVDKFLAGDGTYKDGGKPMVILSYGNSTWNDFITAYNNNVIVYCRASSNSNPATGAQGRMAFMAYINNASSPTEVEFQYYRSVSSHSNTQMGDQVFVYKLNKTSGWSVTTREASIKQISAGSNGNLSVSWSSNKVTIDGGLPAVTSSDNEKTLKVVNGAWSVSAPYEVATTSTAGLMSATDKTNLDNIVTNGLTTANVVDNLTSTETQKPGSANMLRTLKSLLDNGYSSISESVVATSLSDFETALTSACSGLAYGESRYIEVYPNWTGSLSNGVASLARIYRVNVSGSFYQCYIFFGGAQGYYYSNSWHWQKPAQSPV